MTALLIRQVFDGFSCVRTPLTSRLPRRRPLGPVMAKRASRSKCRNSPQQLWRHVEHYVGQARVLERLGGVSVVGIDETSLRRGQQYVTVAHDLVANRLLFAIEGRRPWRASARLGFSTQSVDSSQSTLEGAAIHAAPARSYSLTIAFVDERSALPYAVAV